MSILVTPFFNKDGMIIPKLIVMFSLAMYLLPLIFTNRKIFYKNNVFNLAFALQISILLQSCIVLILSSAPLEQQIFGRSGRGLGFISIFALAVVLIATALYANLDSKATIIFGMIFSAFISSLYSIAQSFGIDLLKWESKTNGVIGTLGNPNFQSAFASMVLVPSFLFFWKERKQLFVGIFLSLFFAFTIYRTQSTQGIIAGFFSLCIATLIFVWYKKKAVFILIFMFGSTSAVIVILGMLNIGPLSSYLYKVSIQSRGDFWRSAFTTANEHPFFGVGLDSFGDYSLKYRDQTAANHTFFEYTDNAHNFYLEQAATGGYPLTALNLALVITILVTFLRLQKKTKQFDPMLASLFSAWIAFQMTTIISPGNLVTMQWNAIISGCALALERQTPLSNSTFSQRNKDTIKKTSIASIIFGLCGFLFLLPLFNTDRLQLLGMQTGDANLVIKATTSYPKSTVRYSQIGRELLESGLTQQALEIARSGVEFNPNSPAMWALILVNPKATIDERLKAKSTILKLDPLNKQVANFIP